MNREKLAFRPSLALALIFLSTALSTACRNRDGELTARQAALIKTEVNQFANSIAVSVTSKGPVAWLYYFEPSPQFFMASDGQIVFADHSAAQKFITMTLVKAISRIKLKWTQVRVDPLAITIASLAAGFHEDLTDSRGKITSINGYFTAVVQKNSTGWHLRNVHWSIKR